ncbi:MAG: hypothetical protein Q7W05_12650, partial [Deltaproteobacteria bacterium]|nr:hypothetical protein [Deltaproteobacteria bacterium]
MKEKRKANFQPRLLYAALALGGVSMIAIALAGDWLVIGGQPGFGQRQLALAFAGGFMLFTAMGLHTGKFQAWTQKTILLPTRMKEVALLLSL